jgi:FkbM family methyltransferase
MILNTRQLFHQLLSTLQINVICDVGSMDGTDALAFKTVSRQSAIYAFEPNPRNFTAMQANPKLHGSDIQIIPWAVGDQDGRAPFYLVKTDYSQISAERGMSSLYERSGDHAPLQVVQVPTTRLDSFLTAGEIDPQSRIALWVDTEGMAFEVIQGSRGVAERIQLLHVEVETGHSINPQQKIYADVQQLLLTLGFTEVATDQPNSRIQFNALFIRRGLPLRLRVRAGTLIARARGRRVLVRVLGLLCPACLRHIRQMLQMSRSRA